ncbi:MAG: TrmH family RNA methyltransferase [Bacteroidota bacterium]
MRKLANQELGRISVSEFKAAEKIPLIIVLDNIRSLNNVGSAFRTSDAFRVKKIYLCGITGTPPHRDIQKTALGATDSVEWEYVQDTEVLVSELKKEEYLVLAIEQAEGSKMLDSLPIETEKNYVLIFGNEVFGVGQKVIDLCDDVIEIPQEGTKHSLNISVSIGIVLWDFWKALKA